MSRKVLTRALACGIIRMSLEVTNRQKGGYDMDIGKRLKELRGDVSRDKVAAEIGISSSALGMYECNKRVPRDDVKKKIADYFGVSIQRLFFED